MIGGWQIESVINYHSFIKNESGVFFVYLNSQLRNQDYLVEDNEIWDLKHIPWLQIRLNLFQS